MALWQNYLRPKTLSEALNALTTAPGPVAAIAGGTDLLIDLDQGRHPAVQTLVDILNVPELAALELRGETLFIGAGVPVGRIVQNPLVNLHARALVEACELIGGPQVRNVATLGGNVAHALPAADGTIALLALDANAEIAGSSGAYSRPISELFVGPGKSALRHGEELLIGFRVPLKTAHQGNSFKRIMRPQGVALPIINVAVWLERAAEVVKEVRVAVGPGAAVPLRATEAEAVLRGAPLDGSTLQRALEALLAQTRFRSSFSRGSAEYRRHLVAGLFEDTLRAAWERAAGEDGKP